MTVLYAGEFSQYSVLAADTHVVLVGEEGRQESKVFCLRDGFTYLSLVGDATFRAAVMVLDVWSSREGRILGLSESVEIEMLLGVVKRCREILQRDGVQQESPMKTTLYAASPRGVSYWEFVVIGASEEYQWRPPSLQTLDVGMAVTNYGGSTNYRKRLSIEEKDAPDVIFDELEGLHRAHCSRGDSLPYDPNGRYSGVIVPKGQMPSYPIMAHGLNIDPFEGPSDSNVQGFLEEVTITSWLSQFLRQG
jgi:hypothetical protein